MASRSDGNTKRRGIPWPLMVVLFGVFAFGPGARAYTDWLWYGEVGRTDVWLKLVLGPWGLGIAVGAFFFVSVVANVWKALRAAGDPALRAVAARLQLGEAVERGVGRAARLVAGLAVGFLALVTGSDAATRWSDVLLWINARPTGEVDPIFGMDIAFYLFTLPVWKSALGLLTSAALAALVICGAIYLFTGSARIASGRLAVAPVALRHVSVLLAVFLFLRAAGHVLARYGLLYSEHGKYVGAGYADVHARIPVLMVMAALTALAGLLILVNLGRKSVPLIIGVVVALLAISILGQGIYPSLVQRIAVIPNELEAERPYLANHTRLTLRAFGLDKVKTREFSPAPQVTAADLARAPETLANVRIWDYRPLHQVYRQRQELRPYYRINDVDVDRYVLNGKARQVLLSARELNVDDVPQQTWINRHLVYTHGCGVVMSSVNAVAGERGEPDFLLRDIPPVAPGGEIAVKEPRIYYGELPYDYCIVNTAQAEFDYPRGDDNATTRYAGKGGIRLREGLTRMLMASRVGDVNLLISSLITPESRIMLRRNIIERIRAAAPFLSLTADPYIVIGDDGRLYWIVDAFTHSDRYPCSQEVTMQLDGAPVRANYLRNPVKVVVDATDGTLGFYLAEFNNAETKAGVGFDPIIASWARAFPGMFSPLEDMPAGLRNHVRVPDDLFSALSAVYARYHMSDPSAFYEQEDLWAVPQETVSDASGTRITGEMEAYYVTMAMPGSDETEFLLIRPYAPNRKTNMIAWLSARNAPEHLGELVVYRFPKQSLVYGPEQVQAQANQDGDISSTLSLWDQAGSSVIFGNLLVIPVGESILYVQPLYLQANSSQIPELRRVIVADQTRIVMRPTLEAALAALTQQREGQPAPGVKGVAPRPPGGGIRPPARPSGGDSAAALRHFRTAQDALKRGDWATYGAEMDAVRRELEALNVPAT